MSSDHDTLGQLKPTLVRASAGSGKTYQLTARLLRTLIQGALPETILATTFTRKAAGEILTRVLLTLAKAAQSDDADASLEKLRQQVGLPGLPRSACLQLLSNLLTNIHRLRICTLDSLFSQIARSFPFELDLPPAWRLTDQVEESRMRQQAVDQMINSLDKSETTALLSMLRKGEAVRSVAGEMHQVVETAYATQRHAGHRAWFGMKAPKRPESKAITAAAGQMLTAEPKQPSLRKKLIEVAAALENRDFASLEKETLITNIAKAKASGQPVKFGRSSFPDGLAEAFDVLYQTARSEAMRLLVSQNQATGTLLQSYHDQIESLKRSQRALGFDDIAVRLAEQFSRLGTGSLAVRMDGAVDHLLLDEFQDTSPVQWSVLRPLAIACVASGEDTLTRKSKGQVRGQATDPVDRVPAVSRSFFCVGDTKQAIYGWRGGVAEIFDAVASEIPGIQETGQNTSFRSSTVIMETVNAIFPRLIRHPMATVTERTPPQDKEVYQAEAVRNFAKRFPEHATARLDLSGYAQLATSPDGGNSKDEKRQACFARAADICKRLIDDAPRKDIGVLTRTNQAVAEMIFLLQQAGVDVSQEGGNPLTDSAAVQVVLSCLMMAEHPGDGRWPLHVSNTPLAKINGFGPDLIRAKVDQFGIAEAVYWLASPLAPVCDARDTLRLKQLTRLAVEYETQPAPRIRDFVQLVGQKRVERPTSASVRVMTVHQSKGLEFDSVVLPQLDTDLVRTASKPVAMYNQSDPSPTAQPVGLTRYVGDKQRHFLSQDWQRAFGKAAAASMTEALCLMYVAMTRARQSLYMLTSPAGKPDFNCKTAASLVYHALGSEVDPTQPETVLWQTGDPDWMFS